MTNEISVAICPYCQTQVDHTEQAMACPSCGVLHHTKCWQLNQGCTTFGCKTSASAETVSTVSPQPLSTTEADSSAQNYGRSSAVSAEQPSAGVSRRFAAGMILVIAAIVVAAAVVLPHRHITTSSSTIGRQTQPEAAKTHSAQAPQPAGEEVRSDASEVSWLTRENPELRYSIDIPQSWSVEESAKGSLHTTVFRAPEDSVSIRVDAMVGIPEKDPLESWEGLESRFVKAYGSRYQRVSMGYSTLGGERSATWVFTLQKRGQPVLKKLDIGLYYEGTGYAVLCTAPVDAFDSWQGTFDHAVASFRFVGN